MKDRNNDAFTEVDDELAKPIANRLHIKWEKETKQIISTATNTIDAIVEHNSAPELVFSVNDHYFNQLIQDMVTADPSMATDDGGARHIYHNIRAYIKTQRKHVLDMASKELVRILYLGMKKEFDKVIRSSALELSKMVKEPAQREVRRRQLSKRAEILKSAIEQLEE